MEKLTEEQRQKVIKMSSDSIKAKLVKAGSDPEKVKAMSREQLLNAIAEFELVFKEPEVLPTVPPGAVGGYTAGPPVGLSMEQYEMWIKLEQRKLEAEERREKEKLEVEERRERDKLEAEERREKERLEVEKAKLEVEKAKLEAEERREKERLQVQKALEERRLEVENRVHAEQRELQYRLHAESMEVQQAKIKAEEEKVKGLAYRTKQIMATLKDVVGMFPVDVLDITSYFDSLENTFKTYEVDGDLKSQVLRSRLHEKAKILVSRLPQEILDSYEDLKKYLLKEYQISPLKLRDRFYSLNKVSEETYTMLATKLRNTWSYYLQGRGGIDSVEQLISLTCADRLKELVPKACLDFILAQEKESWLDEKQIASLADTYMSTHYKDGNPRVGLSVPIGKQGFKSKYSPGKGQSKSDSGHESSTTAGATSKGDSTNRSNPAKNKEFNSLVECYNCGKLGHMKKDCTKPKKVNGNGKRYGNGSGHKTHSVTVTDLVETEVKSVRVKVDVIEDKVNCTLKVNHKSDVANINICDVSSIGVEPVTVNDLCTESEGDLNCCLASADSNLVNVYPSVESQESVIIQAAVISERPFTDVCIEQVTDQKALIDSGSEICCIDSKYVKHLKLPVVNKVKLSGLRGKGENRDVVLLKVRKPTPPNQINIAPPVYVSFAVVPELNEEVIITPPVNRLLDQVATFNVPAAPIVPDVAGNVVVKLKDGYTIKPELPMSSVIRSQPSNRVKVKGELDLFPEGLCLNLLYDNDVNSSASTVQQRAESCDNSTPSTSTSTVPDVVMELNSEGDGTKVAGVVALAQEQANCSKLQSICKQAQKGKGGFFVENGIVYHREKTQGCSVRQLVLPECRYKAVLQMAHDAAFAGHMGSKSTANRIRLHFYIPNIKEVVKEYIETCDVCQRRDKRKDWVRNRVPIRPIERGDELPFNHLVMDCIGPIIPVNDPVVAKPEYNYALVLVDKYSRWPMAYPLKSLSAKATCDKLVEVFMTFAIPKVISSDCGSNFTAELTKEVMSRLGCSPRFDTPGHPEAAGLVERCNQSIKTIIFKLAESNPRGWHKLLPFVLWALRERPNSTTHISPYTLIYGRVPQGPLSVLKEHWEGKQELPLNIGKGPEEYLQALKENLEVAKRYAEYYSPEEQSRYASTYNKESTDRHYSVGDQVLVLAPEGSKLYSRWHGPGTIVKVKSPYSYIVEVEGKQRHLHANNIRKYNVRLNNCAVIYDDDTDFGSVETVEVNNSNEELPSKKIDVGCLRHLTDEQKSQLLAVLDKYPDVFSDKPGFISVEEHRIELEENRSDNSKFIAHRMREYKIPEALKEEVDKQIQEMLQLGIISPSKSDMASPLVCVLKGHKGQNKVRLAVDFRYLNKFTKGDAYPAPDLQQTLQEVSRFKYISCFDAKCGYWQIPVHPDHRKLTGFVCNGKFYEFNRMPFGLKCAGNTFVRAMDKILQNVKEFCKPFVDDMAVGSYTWPEHLECLDKFLQTLREAKVTLNLKKSSFAKSEVKFIGHVIGGGKIKPDPEKLRGLSSIKPPTTKREVRRLIGFFSYFRTFVKDFADISKCITDLTRKEASNKVCWEEKHQVALDRLKQALLQNCKPLHTVDFKKRFILSVDASLHAVGCCLMQESFVEGEVNKKEEKDKRLYPIAFASAKLTETQSKWATIEREAYAVIWALNKYRHWLLFAEVVIYSDHNPLSYLTTAAPKSAKLTRWSLALQEYNICFKYKPGKEQSVPDFLSRVNCVNCVDRSGKPINPDNVRKSYITKTCNNVLKFIY
jgi:hypothetical protein